MLVADTTFLLEQASSNTYAENSRTAGLLHNLGLLLMVSQLPQPMNQLLAWHTKGGNISLSTILKEGVGFDYCEAGGLLADRWKLPTTIKKAMLHHLDYDQKDAEGIVYHAVALVDAVEKNIVVESISPTLGISEEKAHKIFAQINKQLEKTTELAKILFGNG
jgi:HD-like signal output (HDOD) protein